MRNIWPSQREEPYYAIDQFRTFIKKNTIMAPRYAAASNWYTHSQMTGVKCAQEKNKNYIRER